MSRIFLSHSSRDREFVERELIGLLEHNHIDFWYAREDIQTATHWERTILQGLEMCDWFLVVMSPRSEASEWVKDEVDWAMEQRAGRIIPVLLEDCNVRRFHLRMPRIQHLDFRADLADGRRRLLKLLVQASSDPLDVQAEQQRQCSDLQPVYQQILALKRSLWLTGSAVSSRVPSRLSSAADREHLAGVYKLFCLFSVTLCKSIVCESLFV